MTADPGGSRQVRRTEKNRRLHGLGDVQQGLWATTVRKRGDLVKDVCCGTPAAVRRAGQVATIRRIRKGMIRGACIRPICCEV